MLDGHTVADMMTSPIVTVMVDTPLSDAIRILVAHRITSMPVIDRRGRLMGLLGQASLLGALCGRLGSTPMPLNEAQSRALAVTLQILEERCREIRRLLDDPAGDGTLYQVVDDIPTTMREPLLVQVATIEAAIARLAADYQLTAAPHSARQRLVALLSSSSEHLADTRPSKLRRYGSIDSGVVTSLDAALSQLLALIDTMRVEATAQYEEER